MAHYMASQDRLSQLSHGKLEVANRNLLSEPLGRRYGPILFLSAKPGSVRQGPDNAIYDHKEAFGEASQHTEEQQDKEHPDEEKKPCQSTCQWPVSWPGTRQGTGAPASRSHARGRQAHPGDSRLEMAKMPENSIDVIVTDPPYGLTDGFDVNELLAHWFRRLRVQGY